MEKYKKSSISVLSDFWVNKKVNVWSYYDSRRERQFYSLTDDADLYNYDVTFAVKSLGKQLGIIIAILYSDEANRIVFNIQLNEVDKSIYIEESMDINLSIVE